MVVFILKFAIVTEALLFARFLMLRFIDSNDNNFCLNLNNYKKTSVDSYDDTYGAINYEGTVDLQINSFPVPGSGHSFRDVMLNYAEDEYRSDYTANIGKYESNIYYHIVYSD